MPPEAVRGNYSPMLGIQVAVGLALLPNDDVYPDVVGCEMRVGIRAYAVIGAEAPHHVRVQADVSRSSTLGPSRRRRAARTSASMRFAEQLGRSRLGAPETLWRGS